METYKDTWIAAIRIPRFPDVSITYPYNIICIHFGRGAGYICHMQQDGLFKCTHTVISPSDVTTNNGIPVYTLLGIVLFGYRNRKVNA